MVYKPSKSENEKAKIDPHGLKAAPVASSKNYNPVVDAMNHMPGPEAQGEPGQLALQSSWSISDIMNPEKNPQSFANMINQLGGNEEFEFP